MPGERERFLGEVEAAVAWASTANNGAAGADTAIADAAVADRDGADDDALADPFGLGPFQPAIVTPSELPLMPDELVEGVLLDTHKMLLTGPSKAGKTWRLINLATSVAAGEPWLGMRCARRRVLLVDLETDPRTLQRRISRVAVAKGADADAVRANLAVWPLRGKACGLAEISAELFRRCGAGSSASWSSTRPTWCRTATRTARATYASSSRCWTGCAWGCAARW